MHTDIEDIQQITHATHMPPKIALLTVQCLHILKHQSNCKDLTKQDTKKMKKPNKKKLNKFIRVIHEIFKSTLSKYKCTLR